jgi:hypothetical protein
MNKFEEGDFIKVNHEHGSIGKVIGIHPSVDNYYYVTFVYGLDINGDVMESTAGIRGSEIVKVPESEYNDKIKKEG